MHNLYWNVFKNLEKELLVLADAIHIDDKQLEVYSMKIADLLIRTVVEVEAISKALYFSEGGPKPDNNELYFDTDCLNLLNGHWVLSKKVVMVSSPFMYFEKDENKLLTPLHKAHMRGSSSSDWQKAYQAVKHNRVAELKKGNLKHFIHALAALYILNLYYWDQTFYLGKKSNTSAFDATVGSSVFTIKVHPLLEVDRSGIYKKNAEFDECTYLIKTDDKSLEKYKELIAAIENKVLEHMVAEFGKTLKTESGVRNITDIQQQFDDFYKKMEISMGVKVAQENMQSISQTLNSLQYEAVLNKNQF